MDPLVTVVWIYLPLAKCDRLRMWATFYQFSGTGVVLKCICHFDKCIALWQKSKDQIFVYLFSFVNISCAVIVNPLWTSACWSSVGVRSRQASRVMYVVWRLACAGTSDQTAVFVDTDDGQHVSKVAEVTLLFCKLVWLWLLMMAEWSLEMMVDTTPRPVTGQKRWNERGDRITWK